MSRTKNVGRNVYWGLINKAVSIVLPFIVRTVILYKLGTEYLGLSGLFVSILSVLSLTELGFGSALIYNMYEPMAIGDVKKVNALLNLYRRCYRYIGIIILLIGLLLVPFLKYFIHGDYPQDVNLHIIYFIYLFNTVLSYFLFAYKKSILYASQRVDMDSNINTFVAIIQNGVQILFVVLFENYYVYIVVLPFATIINNIWASYVVDKKFPQYTCQGELEKEDIKMVMKNVSGLIYQKIGGVVLLSVDNIIVSAFLGLHILAIYNNYYYIVTSLTGILAIVLKALKPSVGNSIAVESLEKNYKDFNKFNFIYVWIVSWCAITLMNLYQPFMRVWVGEDLMLSMPLVLLFVFYFFTNKWCDMTFVYQEAAGLWYENRFVAIIAAAVNLVLNVILVQIIGLAGVLISTIVSVVFIYDIGYAYVLFKYYFKNTMYIKEFFLSMLRYILVFFVIGVFTYVVCGYVNCGEVMTLIVRGMICVCIPNFLAICTFRNNQHFISVKKMIKDFLKRKC